MVLKQDSEIHWNVAVNSTKTLQWSPIQPTVDSNTAIGGVHCWLYWNPLQRSWSGFERLVDSTARFACLRYLIVESNARSEVR